MSTKLLMLDLDGTVRQCKSHPGGFITSPNDQEFIPGAQDAMAAHKDWKIVGVSNQMGCMLGYKTLTDCIREQEYTLVHCPQMIEILFCPDAGDTCIQILRSKQWEDYFKPYESALDIYKDLRGQYRKPRPGMLLRLLRDYDANPKDCLMVGDRPEDKKAAEAAGVPFVWAEDWRTST